MIWCILAGLVCVALGDAEPVRTKRWRWGLAAVAWGALAVVMKCAEGAA